MKTITLKMDDESYDELYSALYARLTDRLEELSGILRDENEDLLDYMPSGDELADDVFRILDENGINIE